MMTSLIEIVKGQHSQSGSAGPSTPAALPPQQQASSSSDETLKILQEENRQLQLRFDNMRAEQEKMLAQQRARNSAKRDRVRSLLEILAEEDEAADEAEQDVQMVEPAEEEEQEEEWPDLSFAPAAKKAKKDQGEPSADGGSGRPSAGDDGTGPGFEIDLRQCRVCGQFAYTRKNMCLNTQCETWPA